MHMSNAILVKSGGGGVTSEDVTAKKSDILVGKTAVTADSDDEIAEGTLCSDATLDTAASLSSGVIAYGQDGTRIEGTMANMNGGTWTPNSSNQTISCAGKKMNANIIIGAVPSSYVPTSSAYIFNNGAFGNLVNKGWSATSNNVISIRDGKLIWYMASLDYNVTLILTGSIDLTPFKTFRYKPYGDLISATSNNVKLILKNTSKTTVLDKTIFTFKGPASSVTYTEQSYDISSFNGQHFVQIYIGYGGSGSCRIGFEYIRLAP